MTFEIRPATAADGRAIAEIHRETWAATYTQWIPDVVDGYDLERSAEGWAREATAEGGRLTVAANDGGVIGFAASGPARGVDGAGEVYAIYIRPARHGQGVGSALMADALGWMAGLGHPECILWVAEPSTRSRAFYEHVGFRLDEGEGATEPWRGLMTVRYRRPVP